MDKNKYRIEKDSMGDVHVPFEALFGAQTQRAIENFTISPQPLPWNFIRAVLIIKSAAAKTNMSLGLISEENGRLICQAIDELLATPRPDQFPVSVFQTGSGTSTNMNVNEVIAGLCRKKGKVISPNDHVNCSQSSNDVIPTAIHIAAAISTTTTLLPAIKNLATVIRTFGEKNRDVIKTGKTHLMDALPIRLQAEVEGWATQFDESEERISSALPRLLRIPLGGTAVGSGVNCHSSFAKKAITAINYTTELNFTQTPSLYKGLSSLDTIVEFSGHLKTIALALNKVANDLRWMNSGPLSGLGEIKLPALQPGSSIMPAKINPVIPEAVCMAAAQVIGNDTTISIGAMGGNFQLNTMLPVVASNILQSIDLLTGSARSLGEKAIAGITVNREVYDKPLSMNPILITSLAPIIGYMRATEIAKTAQKQKKTVLEIALEQTDIPQEELEKLLNPANLADGGS